MALNGTYTGLQASIADYIKRTDLGAVIPDFIVLAEARIARELRLRSQVTSTTLTTTAGTQAVALPVGWLECENVGIAGAAPVNLVYANIEYLDSKYPDGYFTGKPAIYSIEGSSLMLGPTPDAAYAISLLYYKRYDALSVTPTNYLLTTHPSIYLFAALAEACVYTLDNDRVTMWEAKYKKEIESVQDTDQKAQFSGSALRVRKL